MKTVTVKLLVKMAGPDGVHMPGEIIHVPAADAERMRAAGMAVGPNDPMPEPQKASDLSLQASGAAEAPEA